jgi:hypothetical protein
MKKSAIWVGALVMLFGTTLPARDISGDWQGTPKAGPQELLLVLAIDKSADGKWNATLGSTDQNRAHLPTAGRTKQGRDLNSGVDVSGSVSDGWLPAPGAPAPSATERCIACPNQPLDCTHEAGSGPPFAL